jgi:hypothetical protein
LPGLSGFYLSESFSVCVRQCPFVSFHPLPSLYPDPERNPLGLTPTDWKYGKNRLNGSNGEGTRLLELAVSQVQSLVAGSGSIAFYRSASSSAPFALLAWHTRRCDIPE